MSLVAVTLGVAPLMSMSTADFLPSRKAVEDWLPPPVRRILPTSYITSVVVTPLGLAADMVPAMVSVPAPLVLT